jgi:hypothetical protein
MLRLALLLCWAQRLSADEFREPGQAVRFTHIPKTGGTSLRVDLQPRGVEIGHLEYCAGAPEVGFLEGGFNFVFLRSPRAHVLSQYLECRYDKWGQTMTAMLPEFPFPRNGSDEDGFAEWVKHFHSSTFSELGKARSRRRGDGPHAPHAPPPAGARL